MLNKLPITATMVVYNEEKTLERAIRSFYHLVDEIIIVHDGKCIDNSVKIANKYTKNVFVRKHIGTAEPHRIFEIKKAKNDWILMVDPDDILSPGLQKVLPKLIKANVDIYEFASPFFYKKKLHYGGYRICLFKKSKAYLIGSTHEYVKPLGKDIVIRRINYGLINKPQYENFSFKKFKTKWIIRAKIQASELAGDFKKIPKLNYTSNKWDYPNSLRVKHPLLLGILGSSFYHFFQGVRNAIKKKDFFHFRLGVYMALYFTILYYNVFILKRKKLHE